MRTENGFERAKEVWSEGEKDNGMWLNTEGRTGLYKNVMDWSVNNEKGE